MELLLLPSRGAATSPLHQPSPRRVAGVFTARPAAASSSNVEVIDTTATAAAAATATARGDVAKNRQEWRAAGGLGLNLSEDMRRGMMWRMLAPPAAAVAAEAAFLRVLDGAPSDAAPAWAGAAGSAVLFTVGLLGFHYGFLSSRWDAAERGSLVGWELAASHWSELSMAKHSSTDDEGDDADDDDDDEEDEDENEEEDDEDSD
uniref:Uncharacterized protein n=1 Tax=Oryza punctata TaxID=4537 RepID=A0A0E0K5T0_ORYPU